MILCRRPRLATVLVCLCFSIPPAALAQQATPPAQQPPPPQQKKQNPFEAVPQSAEPPKPQAPKQPALEAPKPAEEPKPGSQENIIEAIEFRGARRVPQDTLRAQTFTKKGDKFDPEALRRDFMALWNTSRFDDITIETEPGKVGIIVRYILVERRVVRRFGNDKRTGT